MNKVKFLWKVSLSIVVPATLSLHASPLVDFSDLTLDPDSFYNGGPDSNSDGWTSGGVFFGNEFTSTEWGGFWNGFAHSNVNDPTTPGFGNQYAAITGTAHRGSIYAVAFQGPHAFFNLPTGFSPSSVQVTNTTYTYFSMQDGDQFAKQFTPEDNDFFEVTFIGYDAPGGTGNATGSVTVALADFRGDKAFILDQWQHVDLSPLGTAASVGFSFASSDVGDHGINTPQYVALDSLLLVPEPGTAVLLLTAAGLLLNVWRRRKE